MTSVLRFLNIATLACLLATLAVGLRSANWRPVLARMGWGRPQVASPAAIGSHPVSTPGPSPTGPSRPDVRAVAAAFPEPAGPAPAKAGPIALQYNGKTYEEWRTILLSETNSSRRLEPVQALATLGANGMPDQATRDLLEVLQSLPQTATTVPEAPDAKLAESLVAGIRRVGPKAAPVLLTVLRSPESADVCRRVAAETLAISGFGAREWVPAALKLLQSGDHRSQELARIALRGQPPVSEELAAALADELARNEAPVRVQVLNVFREMETGSRRVTSALLRQLKDPEASVREAAVSALEASGFFAACQSHELEDYGVTAAMVHDAALLPGFRSGLELAGRGALRDETAVAILKLLMDLGLAAKDSADAVEKFTAAKPEALRAAARQTLDEIRRK